uniref:Uncharacterized protein n=1 Tax=Aegilops tauschii subsp. strangulata TaxID=200361 RepID=A0A453LML7_AEGTS
MKVGPSFEQKDLPSFTSSLLYILGAKNEIRFHQNRMQVSRHHKPRNMLQEKVKRFRCAHY